MPIPVDCWSCGSRFNAPGALAGWKVKCPKCGRRVPVPGAAATAAAPRPQPARGGLAAKKSRPNRQPRNRALVGVPAWVWWLGGGAGLLAAVVALLLGPAAGKPQLLYAGLAFLVMLPISTGILVLSMVISSRLAGGIDFGEARVVIPKAFALLVAVNLIGLLPLGFVFALPVWLIGLMALFRLDLREARTLSGVNWALNTVVNLFLLAAILSALLHGGLAQDNGRPDPARVRQAGQVLEGLGGN